MTWSMLIFLLVASSCSKDEYFGPVTVKAPMDEVQALDSVLLIGCEGNFQLGNASLSRFNIHEDQVENDVFSRVNGYVPGDVLQSLYRKGDSVFMVMNNSGLIRVLDKVNLKEIHVMEGFNSPRHIIRANKDFYVVTDYGSALLQLIKATDLSTLRSVATAEWTEGMAVINNLLSVAAMSDSSLWIYSLPAMELQEIHQLKVAPRFVMQVDTAVYIAGSGAQSSEILKLNADGLTSVATLIPKLNGCAFYEGKFYVLTGKDVLLINLEGTEIQRFEHDVNTPYSIYVDYSGIYITDVKDFISKGEVRRYGLNFSLMNTMETGFIPQAMLGF